jgi:hydroxyacylglutathione hydrolase
MDDMTNERDDRSALESAGAAIPRHLHAIAAPGLGVTSYLIESEGRVAVVDPQRDIEPYLRIAESRRAPITLALETHVHEGHLSGARELAARGATVAGPARAGYHFPHLRVVDGDAVELGSLRLVAKETPGHTTEHCAYLVVPSRRTSPVVVFTGGTPLEQWSGTSGRMEPVPLPTHASLDDGSRGANIRAINRTGPRLVSSLPPVGPIPADAVAEHLAAGGWVIDLRHRMSFASAHLPGTINVELDSEFAYRIALVVPFNEPLVLIPPHQEREAIRDAVTHLRRVGFDNVLGYLRGGVGAWRWSGRMAVRIPMIRARDVAALSRHEAGRIVLVDVREPNEWDEGHVPGSLSIPLSDLWARLGDIPADREVVVIAAIGRRASTAASLLARAGRRSRFVGIGGVEDLMRPATLRTGT